MKGHSIRRFAVLFSGLGSAGVLTLLGGLWLLQRVGGPGLLCVVAGQGLMVVSSLMGMLACYRHSRSLVLDREEEVKELLGWALCALLLPTLTNIEIALSAFLFPQPLLQLTEGFSLTMEQGNLVLWVAGLVFSTLGAVCIGTIAYGVLAEPRWALASDCLIWLNFLLVLIGQTILIAAIHLRRVTLLPNVSIGMEEFLGVMIAIVGYVGARAVQTSSLILLRVYVLLGVVCAGVGLVAAVYGWLAGVRVSTHLSADCLDAMASAHSSQLEDLNCATKYTNFSLSLESLPCSKPEMRLDWESISLNSLQDFACLNSTCCSQLPLSLEATSESISVQVLGAAIASGLAAGLVLAFVRQMTYDDKDHFAGICVLLGMLVSTVGVGVWLSLSKPYLSETQAAPGSHSIRLPMRLFEPGGCVTGLTLPSQPCSHCKFTVTTENSLLYDHRTPLQTTTLQGSQPETVTAFSSLIVCPICPISTMTVLVTPEGSTVPEVNTFEWTSRVNVFGTVYFEDEPLPDVEVDLDVPGCQIVTFNSDDKGRYQVSVPLAPDLSPYNVTLHFTKDGFLPVSLRHSIGGITSFNEFPALDMTPHSLLFSSVAVYLFDVTTNTRISSGRVEVREGYNNITGEVKDAVEVVEGVGMVEELRPGVYTLVCSSQGLYTDVTEVTVLPNSHQEKAALLSPVQSGLRVVLGWESERDMDLSVQFAGCWVGFFNKMCGAAQLHADNRLGGSSGGEALTFTSLQSGSYLFTVNSFRSASDSGSATLRFYWHSPLPFLRLQLEPDSPGVCLDGTSMFVSPVGVEGNCTSHELPEVSGWVARPK